MNKITMKIIQGECLSIMKSMSDNSIDFIVTDPPYGLNFMNKHWDKAIPNEEIWLEALRICKPGSMLAAFGGSRTHHHIMISLEKAGWEIRDVIMWLYGSGFPKSHNHFGLEGYGTTLKPAYEPIIICMKPLDRTYKNNVEKWGLGGININESRIESMPRTTHCDGNYKGSGNDVYESGLKSGYYSEGAKGRWPANIILDEEASGQLDDQSGISKSSSHVRHNTYPESNSLKLGLKPVKLEGIYDSEGASRFFYCAKASPNERKGNNHPTVKPISLMKYIIKLLAPPGNPICLDPFAGSGSTLVAAKELGIDCIGIEMNEEYCEIANTRLKNHE